MFNYKGCKGKKEGEFWWLTYEDGTKDVCCFLRIALMLCDKTLKRA